jgi:hypothetical protein
MTSLWQQAKTLAQQTPSSRNRAADLFRALSILVVVLAHWLMAAPYIDINGLHIDHLLARSPWTQWFTWVLQVMPVFFFVGGFSNGITWDAAVRKGHSYGEWLTTRLRRLLFPVFILVLFWTLTVSVAYQLDVATEILKAGSQIALVPTWFLAIYGVIVVLAPMARTAWQRWGLSTLVVLIALSIVGDILYFHLELEALGWFNYLFIWLAVHQLGFVWLDGRLTSKCSAVSLCILGAFTLVIMIKFGPWPLSLVGVPGAEISNTTPPHLPLLALAAFQFGLVLIVQDRVNKALENIRLWTGTVMLNGMIMTVFLWHSTVMMLLFGAAVLAGGIGLQAEPSSQIWWLSRAVWILIFSIGLIPFVAAFLRFESASFITQTIPPTWRLLAGTGLITMGLAITAYGGIAGEGFLGLNLNAVILIFTGSIISGIVPLSAPR